MRKWWLVPAWAFAFGVSWLVGGQPHLLQGHDHWCSGHLMLLVDSYHHAGFATPLGMPVEDPFGPIGEWAPYTGWPPLHALVMALLLKITGPTLLMARLFAAMLTATSAVLLLWITWQATRTRLAALLGYTIFLGHPAILKYCTFTWNDTAGLTWSLLLVCLYPALVVRPGRLALLAYCMLTAIGGLLSWHCYLISVCCALALALTDRAALKAGWVRTAAPVVTASLVGVALLLVYRYLDSHYDHNYRTLGTSFRDRIRPFADPRSLKVVVEYGRWTVSASSRLFFVLVVVLGINYALRGSREQPSPAGEGAPDLDRGRFYFHALWLFPALWLLAMPTMHVHEFQMVFLVPLLALLCSVLIQQTLPLLGQPILYGFYGLLVLAGFVAIGCSAALELRASRNDSPVFAQLEQDIQALTREDTIVITEFVNKGTWWRIRRPFLFHTRAWRAEGREHVLVVLPGSKGWEDRYTVLRRREGQYLILKPKASISPL